jgi:hypothetical protein
VSTRADIEKDLTEGTVEEGAVAEGPAAAASGEQTPATDPEAAAADAGADPAALRAEALELAQEAAADNDVAAAIYHLDVALGTFGASPAAEGEDADEAEAEDALLRAVLLRERAQLHVWMNSEEAEGAIEAARAALDALRLSEADRSTLTAQLALVVAWARATTGDPEGGLDEAIAAAELLWEAGHPAVVDAALVRGLLGKFARGPETATLEGVEGLPVELVDTLVERVALLIEHTDPRLALALLLELHERLLRLEEPEGPLAPGPRGDAPAPTLRSEQVAALIGQHAILAAEGEVAVDAAGWAHRQRLAAGDAAGAIGARLAWGELALRAGRGDEALDQLRQALAEVERGEGVDPEQLPGLRLAALWAIAEAHAFLGRHEGAATAYAAAVAAAAAPGVDPDQAVAVGLDQALHLAAGGQAEAALAGARTALEAAAEGSPEAQVAQQILDNDAFIDPISGESDRMGLLGARLRLRAPVGLIDGVTADESGAVEVIFARWPTTGDAGRARLLVEAGLRTLALG